MELLFKSSSCSPQAPHAFLYFPEIYLFIYYLFIFRRLPTYVHMGMEFGTQLNRSQDKKEFRIFRRINLYEFFIRLHTLYDISKKLWSNMMQLQAPLEIKRKFDGFESWNPCWESSHSWEPRTRPIKAGYICTPSTNGSQKSKNRL
jgi:hypothetical protein